MRSSRFEKDHDGTVLIKVMFPGLEFVPGSACFCLRQGVVAVARLIALFRIGLVTGLVKRVNAKQRRCAACDALAAVSWAEPS